MVEKFVIDGIVCRADDGDMRDIEEAVCSAVLKTLEGLGCEFCGSFGMIVKKPTLKELIEKHVPRDVWSHATFEEEYGFDDILQNVLDRDLAILKHEAEYEDGWDDYMTDGIYRHKRFHDEEGNTYDVYWEVHDGLEA